MKIKLLVACLTGLCISTTAFARDFTVKDIRVEGLQRVEADTVFDYLPIKVGDKFTSTKGEQIIKDLYATGFFDDIQVEVQNDQVLLTVVEKPIIGSFEIKGGKTFSNQLIKDNLNRIGLGESKVYDPYLMKASMTSLQQEYVNMGKNNVEIKPEIVELERNRVDVTLNVTEGDTTRIKKIEFEGNKTFSDRTLRRQMKMVKNNLLSFFTKSDIFSGDKFDADQEAITRYYKNRGFYDFQITNFEPKLRENDPKSLDLFFTVDEGDRYKWGQITVSGDSKEVPLSRLQAITKTHNKRFALVNTKWFNQSQLDRVVNLIKLELGKSGYAKAEVNVNPTRNPETGTIDFDINIAANQKVFVRQIDIVGNTKTRDEVIRRELRQQENSSYDSGKLQRSKERVATLGYFEDMEFNETPVADSEDEVDLEVKVKERNVGNIDFSLGYVQDDGLVVSGSFSHDNLWGTGRQVSAKLSTGGTSKALALTYLDPYYTKHGVGLGFDFSAQKFDPNKIETSSYKSKTFSTGVKLVFPLTDYDKLDVRLGTEYRKIDLFERSPLYYKQYIARNGKSGWIFPLSVAWNRSTVDDYLWPTRGYILDTKAEVTLPGISDHLFYKFTHQQWWFFPLTEHMTLMLTGQAGLINNYGKSKDVPFYYNFHTGGIGSVRGFDSSSLGPKINNWYGDVDYIGGTKVATLTAELFFPMPGMRDNKNVRLSTFVDAGSLWDGKTRTIIDNVEYENNYKSSFKNELRYSAGVGMVWISPLGPLRFSWAKPLNSKAGDRVQRFQFNIGNTF